MTKTEMVILLRKVEDQLASLRMLFKMQSETIEVLNRAVSRMNDTIINLVAGTGG